jgi:hypothetical protein
MKVGVRELKQNLTPVSAPDPFARGIEEGLIRPPMVDDPVGHHPLETSSRRVLDVLASDRDE